MNTPAIVAIGYNRPDSLKRLLDSLEGAVYPGDVHPALVISLDKSDTDEVVKVAESFEWTHGEKRVIARDERMGLKAHVLACSDLVYEYGSVIVLEDDLYVSPSFYEYAVKALDYTEDDGRVGGVSLYNHLFNVHRREAFCAIDDGYDNWYFQMASSWGQAYTKSQWDGFKRWYADHNDNLPVNPEIPANVSGWSEKSWLKYYIAYLIDTQRYFLYPRISYTTNFGDAGSHAVKKDTDLQVPIAGAHRGVRCNFSRLTQSQAVYDAYFENMYLSGRNNEVIVDLYGIKPVEELARANDGYKYVLSSASLPYRVVKTYGRQMRPVDANIVYNVSGDEYKLYCLAEGAKEPTSEDEALRSLYQYRGIAASQMVKMIKYRIAEKLKK